MLLGLNRFKLDFLRVSNFKAKWKSERGFFHTFWWNLVISIVIRLTYCLPSLCSQLEINPKDLSPWWIIFQKSFWLLLNTSSLEFIATNVWGRGSGAYFLFQSLIGNLFDTSVPKQISKESCLISSNTFEAFGPISTIAFYLDTWAILLKSKTKDLLDFDRVSSKEICWKVPIMAKGLEKCLLAL